MRVAQAPALGVVTLVGTGLGVCLVVDWEPGLVLVGLALVLAAALRLALTPQQAGWLAVRGRGVDATLLLVLGLGVIALARSVPR